MLKVCVINKERAVYEDHSRADHYVRLIYDVGTVEGGESYIAG